MRNNTIILILLAAALWLTLVKILGTAENFLRKRRLKPIVMRLTAASFISIKIISLLYGVFYFAQDAALFHPNHDPDSYAYITSLPDFETVEVTSGTKTWHGILRRTASDGPSPLILFFPGNGQSSSRVLSEMEASGIWPYFNDYQCLIMDYPGYGLNGGRPSAKSMYEQALAVFDYASALPIAGKIIVGGYSIGTGPAAYLASQREVDGLFLLAPFAGGYDLYNSVLPIFSGPMRLFVRHKFPSGEYAGSVNVPALVVASRDDEVVPFASSEKLNSLLGGDFIVLSGVDHNSILFNRTTLDGIKTYLNELDGAIKDAEKE